MMPGYGGMDGWGWGWLMMFGSTILLLLLVGITVWLLARTTSGSQSPAGPQIRSAREILAERYARGEIDEDEYRRRLAVLEGK